MLLLTFRVAQDLYAVDVTRVVEVVPRVDPRPIPRTPPFLAGLFGYRGRVVPAIDMGLLLGKACAPARLSTRVILVEARDARSGGQDRAPRRAGGVSPLSSEPDPDMGLTPPRSPDAAPAGPDRRTGQRRRPCRAGEGRLPLHGARRRPVPRRDGPGRYPRPVSGPAD